MSDFSRFRTAVGGFSRTDVVNYIEETSAAHQKALRKLEDEKQAFADENDHLLAENTRLQAELSDLRAEHEKLKEEDSALSAQVVSLSDEASELAAQLEPLWTLLPKRTWKRNPPTKIPHSRKQPRRSISASRSLPPIAAPNRPNAMPWCGQESFVSS